MDQIFVGMGYYAAPDRPLLPYWIKPGEERLELLIAGKATRSTKLPFAPFFLAAVLLMWIAEGSGSMACG